MGAILMTKTIISVVLCIILALTIIPGCSRETPADTFEKTVSILFVGNSFIFKGNVPKQIKTFCAMYGIDVTYTTIAPGGAALRKTKKRAIAAMETKKFDYAVFQDKGGRQLFEPQGFVEDIKELCDAAKHSGAIPVLYNPAWPNNDGIPDEREQYKQTRPYLAAAKQNDAVLVNAGDAWVYAYRTVPDISLYKHNDFHANNAGAYLTACVFVSTLFGLQVKDIAPDNLYHGEDALALGRAAWEFYLASFSGMDS